MPDEAWIETIAVYAGALSINAPADLFNTQRQSQ